MILSFADADTRALAQGNPVRRFAAFERVARRKLRQLEIAGRLEDLRIPPGNHLEKLRGDREGQMSIGSMTSGAFALPGPHLVLIALKLLITTKKERD